MAYEKLIKFIAGLEGTTPRLQFKVSSREKRAAERIEKMATDFSNTWKVIKKDDCVRFKDAKYVMSILRRKFVAMLPELSFVFVLTPNLLQELDDLIATSDPTDNSKGSSRDDGYIAFWHKGIELRQSLDHLVHYCRERDPDKSTEEDMKKE